MSIKSKIHLTTCFPIGTSGSYYLVEAPTQRGNHSLGAGSRIMLLKKLLR